MSEATSPTTSGTNGVDADPVVAAWQRYERLKANDTDKNSLIEVSLPL